jgi:hypothetical protein
MATYTPEQLGIKPPPGGFQVGGWYQSRQFWGGTLSEPGQIHPSSNQPGAGGLVSEEVIAQTNPANVAYIQQQRANLNLPPSPATGVPSGGQITPAPAGTAPTTPTTGAGLGIQMPGTSMINLPNLYSSLYESSGISAKEAELTNKEKQYLEAKAKISDNPFLSASMVDKRLARLEAKYKTETDPLRNEIATKKADIETQLNLQTKQFDINSQAARDALNYFNTLLDSGALNNASGEDIANLTRATGLSSSAIYSAINAKKEKDVETQVITSEADDGTVTASVINPRTGEIISQTNLGQIGNQQISGGGATATERLQSEQQETSQNLISDAQRGATLRQLVGHYGIPGGLDIDTIYRLYNTYSPHGIAKETLEQVKQGIFLD